MPTGPPTRFAAARRSSPAISVWRISRPLTPSLSLQAGRGRDPSRPRWEGEEQRGDGCPPSPFCHPVREHVEQSGIRARGRHRRSALRGYVLARGTRFRPDLQGLGVFNFAQGTMVLFAALTFVGLIER